MALTQEFRVHWSFRTRLLFQFLCLYFTFYILSQFFGGLLTPLIKWVGTDILNVSGPLDRFPTGSGDTTIAYVTLFINAVFAVLGSFIWAILDRNRKAYNDFFYWFLVIVRIFLIYFMIVYGFAKIFKSQFPGPSLWRLMQPIGDMSPMGLAWTYMGHSTGFNFFAGFMEVLGGLLLIPRRTQTLGAIVIIAVMTQVAMINFFYDVPVKLFSIHLVLMGIFIFTTDIRRFVNVFILNQKIQRYQYHHPIKDKTYTQVIMWLKVALTVILIGVFATSGYSRVRNWGDKREKPPLYGIWEVQTYIKNSDTIPPLITDHARWRYMLIDYKERVSIKTMTDSTLRRSFLIDSTNAKIYLGAKEGVDYELTYNQPNNQELRLNGIIDYDTIQIHLKAKDLSKIRLTNRGFHWINEQAYNR